MVQSTGPGSRFRPSDSATLGKELPAAWSIRVDATTAPALQPEIVALVDDARASATFYHPSGPNRVKAKSVVLIEPNAVHSCNPLHGHIWSYRMPLRAELPTRTRR